MAHGTFAAVLLTSLACGAAGTASAFAQPPCEAPPPPDAVVATVSGTFVVVKWAASDHAPLAYVVEAGTAPQKSDVYVGETIPPATSVEGPLSAGAYVVRVRVRNACGLGAPSREIPVVTGTYQDHPEMLVMSRTPERNVYFPSLVRIGKAELLVAYYDSPEHVSPLGRISMVRSLDSGRTWSPPRVIVDTPLDDRDPSLTVTRKGRLLLTYFARDSDTGRSAGVFMLRSDDNGATWSPPSRIQTRLTDVATSSKIIETPDGDLLIPLYGSTDYVNSRVTIARSRDGGGTWPLVDEVEIAGAPGANFLEPALAVVGRRMLVLMRTDRADNSAFAAQSTDGGVTWSTPAPINVAAQASDLVPVAADRGTAIVHLWADWGHRYGDSRPTVAQMIRWPADAAAPVFGDPQLLYNSHCDDTGYPSAVVLDDGRLFVVFYDACLGYIGGAYLTPGTLR